MAMRGMMTAALAVVVAASLGSMARAQSPIEPDRVYELVTNAATVIRNLPFSDWKPAIGDPEGEFQLGKGACYVFVITCQGGRAEVVATSYAKETIGMEGLMDLPGPGGDHPVKMVCEAATPQGRWVAYQYENPVNGKPERKITFTIAVRGTDGKVYTLSAGIYDPERRYTLDELNEGLQ